jgi:hypothetical protein
MPYTMVFPTAASYITVPTRVSADLLIGGPRGPWAFSLGACWVSKQGPLGAQGPLDNDNWGAVFGPLS